MFSFLLYIRPTWYYRLAAQSKAPVLADYHKLNKEEQALITLDNQYKDPQDILMDAAYQGLMRGVIPSMDNALAGDMIKEVTRVDSNYRFVRKYYATHWYVYAFILRLLTLHNPIRETFHFVKNWKTKRLSLTKGLEAVHKERMILTKEALSEKPLVSVIIPTLNRYEYLKDVLADLEKQNYPNFEVIVCDQSEPVREDFYQDWNLNLTLLKQEEKALWLARNECIRIAKGDYILLFDDDSRVEQDWITQHLLCMEQFGVKISAGVTHTLVGHGLSPKESYFHLSDVFDTGNSLVHKDVFRKVGLFDRQFEKQRMGDGEFGLRALLGGYQVISNPKAMRVHLKAETGGLRQMGSWDALRPRNLLAPRPIPSVLYLFRKYYGNGAARYYLIQNLPTSFVSYKHKRNRSYKIGFFLLLPFLLPLMFFVALKSWRLASRKMNEGPRISFV